jgi:hypothetical protein
MAQAVSRQPLIAEARVRARFRVGFVVDKATMEQAFLEDLKFSPVNIIPPLSTHVSPGG